MYNGVQAQEVQYRNNYGEYSGVIYAQENGTMLSNRFGVVKVEGIVAANEVFGIDGNGATPVSYTPLDVYKRQSMRCCNASISASSRRHETRFASLCRSFLRLLTFVPLGANFA